VVITQIDEIIKAIGEVEVNVVSNIADPYTVAVATRTSREIAPQIGGEGNRTARREASKSSKKKQKR
jgi:hypothetical protein